MDTRINIKSETQSDMRRVWRLSGHAAERRFAWKIMLSQNLWCIYTCAWTHGAIYTHVCSLFTGIALLGYTKELAEGRGCKETRVEHVPMFLYSNGISSTLRSSSHTSLTWKAVFGARLKPVAHWMSVNNLFSQHKKKTFVAAVVSLMNTYAIPSWLLKTISLKAICPL